MKNDILFTPFNIGSLSLKNRFVMTPMETGMAGFDGRPTELLTDYYLQRVRGGTALICTGICRVNNIHGAAAPKQLSLVHNSSIPSFQMMNDRIHAEGGKIAVQLHHPGRQNYSALIGIWPMVEVFSKIPGFSKIFSPIVKSFAFLEEKIYAPPVSAPSAIPCGHVNQKTRAFKTWEIRSLVKDFVKAASRAKRAGFDAVELHAAHGYLIQQFLSPYSNRRTDEYGGSFENRLRFIKEIIEGIRLECGSDYPLLVRLTVEEFISEDKDNRGITLDLGVKIAKALEELGVDALDISSGSYEQTNKWLETVNYKAGWRKYLAAAVKKEVNIPIIAANLIRSAEQAVSQIEEGTQDLIGLGRPLLADPELPLKIKEGREDEISRCIVCCQCYESLLTNAWLGKPLRCSVNPTLSLVRNESQKSEGTVVVVGAGAAGLQASLTLKKRGFHVVLFEKSSEPGGQILLADKAPDKEKLGWCIDDLSQSVSEAGVDIRLNTTADAEAILDESPDAIILATGGIPIKPPITGVSQDNVYTFDEILSGSRFPEDGEIIAVIGSGLTGLETAEYILSKGKNVMVVEMADNAAPGAHFQHRDEALESLEKDNALIYTSMKLTEIREKSILLEHTGNGEKKELETDAVVLALGSRALNELEKELSAFAGEVHVIGDASGIGRIADAVEQAYKLADRLAI